MRLSSGFIFDAGTNGLLRNQYQLYRIQNQISTGRRVVTPADDPVAAAQALIAGQKQNVNQQFMAQQATARSEMAALDSQLKAMGDLITEVRSRWVEAGNGAYSDSELKDIAVDIRGRFEQLLGIANNSDATGVYRFAGFQGGTQPFVNTGGGVVYQGDDGNRELQVEANRLFTVSLSGRDVFERIPNGNGTFVTGAATGNTGTGVISNGTVVGSFSGQSYAIVFDTPNSYTVNGGPSIPYTNGDDINLGGASFSISGAPAVGDQFTVAPSQAESAFVTLDRFISALEAGRGGGNQTNFQNEMLRVGASLDRAFENVLSLRAMVGVQGNELDAMTQVGKDMDIQYETQISDLIDLDYASAISDLSKRKLQLEAAQQSFVKVTGLSLFNFI